MAGALSQGGSAGLIDGNTGRRQGASRFVKGLEVWVAIAVFWHGPTFAGGIATERASRISGAGASKRQLSLGLGIYPKQPSSASSCQSDKTADIS